MYAASHNPNEPGLTLLAIDTNCYYSAQQYSKQKKRMAKKIQVGDCNCNFNVIIGDFILVTEEEDCLRHIAVYWKKRKLTDRQDDIFAWQKRLLTADMATSNAFPSQPSPSILLQIVLWKLSLTEDCVMIRKRWVKSYFIATRWILMICHQHVHPIRLSSRRYVVSFHRDLDISLLQVVGKTVN